MEHVNRENGGCKLIDFGEAPKDLKIREMVAHSRVQTPLNKVGRNETTRNWNI